MNAKKRSFLSFPLGKKEKLLSLIIVVIVLLVFVKFAGILGENKPEKEKDLDLVVRLNLGGDFPNPEEGTAVFNMRLLMDKIILKFQKVPKYVMFAESKTIPGLILRYNVHGSAFEAGLPLISSGEVTFLDGNMHEIVYTFKKGAEQKLYFDKKEVASGIFDDNRVGITSFTVSDFEEYNIQTIDIDGSAEFK